MMVWAVSLSSAELSPDVLTAVITRTVFVVCQGWVPSRAPVQNRALPQYATMVHLSGTFPRYSRCLSATITGFIGDVSKDTSSQKPTILSEQSAPSLAKSTTEMDQHDASPKAISRRTSYLQVRLAFHLQPQVIRAFCNSLRFGPPRSFTCASACPWLGHLVSGLIISTNFALFRLAFTAPPSNDLGLH
jgi:hypothetical protein